MNKTHLNRLIIVHFISAPVFKTVAAFPPISFWVNIFHFHCSKKQKNKLAYTRWHYLYQNPPTSSTMCAQSGQDMNGAYWWEQHCSTINVANIRIWHQYICFLNVWSSYDRRDQHRTDGMLFILDPNAKPLTCEKWNIESNTMCILKQLVCRAITDTKHSKMLVPEETNPWGFHRTTWSQRVTEIRPWSIK